MSRGVIQGGPGLAPAKGRQSKDDPDLALAMDLAYNLSRRKQKCSSPFHHSSNKSGKSRFSDRKDRTSTPLKTRARQMKAHETEPFLSVDTVPEEKRHVLSESTITGGHRISHGQSASRMSPMSPMGPRQMSRFSMYSSPSIPTRHTLTRDSSSRRAMMSSMSQKTLSSYSKTKSPNHHIKMPFKHSVHKPPTPAPPDRAASPSRELKERTALATYHVNKVLALEKHTSQQKNKGKLLRANDVSVYDKTGNTESNHGTHGQGVVTQRRLLKPLYPVQLLGPSIENCRGIVADTHQYVASPSRTLQRRKQILSSMNSGELKDLLDRPRTVESIHRTSVASSIDDNRDDPEESKPHQEWSPESHSSAASTPAVLPDNEQDLNEVTVPPDFVTSSPLLSRESSHDTLKESSRDTSTVFLTTGRNVQEAEEELSSRDKTEPEIENASREIIEMAEMLKKRISLIGIETGDLLEAESRGNDVKTEESSETGSRSGCVQDDQQSATSSVESRVRPFSATAQMSQTVNPLKLDTRPLSTGDVSRRKVPGSKSVRFADETDNPQVSQAWNEDSVSGDKSSESDNTNNNAVCENSKNLSSGQSKSRCKPNEIELGKNNHDPDDDKENYAPKKSFFSSSQTFSQALSVSSDQQLNSSESFSTAPKDDVESVTHTSFMEEFLAHAAPIDDSVCSVSSEEYLQDDFGTKGRKSEEQKDTIKPFPLMSLSERIARACQRGVKPVDCERSNTALGEQSEVTGEVLGEVSLEVLEEVTVDVIEKITEEFLEEVSQEVTEEVKTDTTVATDPAVNLTFSSHEMLSEFEQNYGGIEADKDKPSVNKTRRRKSKSRGSSKATERPPPPNGGYLGSPNQKPKKEGDHNTKCVLKSIPHLRHSHGSYGVEGRHHFPSDMIVSGEKDRSKVNMSTNQDKARKARNRPSSGSSGRPSSGHCQQLQQQVSSSFNKRSRNIRNEVPVLDFDEGDDIENVDISTYDDLDRQINLIQSELKKNIDQQEMLLSETESLRLSLRSREDFHTDQGAVVEDEGVQDRDSSTVTLHSDSYYQSLLMSYRKKCMEVSENCLMISEHITSPRWQSGTTPSQTMQDSKTQRKEITSKEETVLTSENRPEVDTGCDNEAGTELKDQDMLSPGKSENFLRLLCTTVEEVEEPNQQTSSIEISSNSWPRKPDLKVVATRKELSNEKVKPRVKPSAPFPPLCFSINARPPQGYLYYFSYSEHMNTNRMSLLLKRDISQRLWGLLMGFNLMFNKKGEDTEVGGFANIEFNPFCSVEGCVYQLTQADLTILDRCIGVPEHYCRVVLPVWMSNTTDPDALGIAQYCVPAVTYLAQDQWILKEPLSGGYSLSQCVRSADLLSPAYRSHLDKLATASAPFIQPTTA